MFYKIIFNMIPQRIVSFLPSTTELIFELGCQDKLYGVTHECIYPKEAKLKPRVVESVFDANNLSSKQIDDEIIKLMSEGKNIFKLNIKNLRYANPDIIITQEICQVCSAYTNEVNNAIEILGKKLDILTINPHDIDEIMLTINEISKKLDLKKKVKK